MGSKLVRRLTPNTVVGIVYVSEGSAMHNMHTVTRRIYVGSSRGEIERAIAEENGITGSVKEYLNRSWASIVYYDDQAEIEAEQQRIRDAQPDLPTRIRTICEGVVAEEWGKATLRFGNVSYAFDPAKELGITGDYVKGIVVKEGQEFVVPYKFAKFLVNSSRKTFELVE